MTAQYQSWLNDGQGTGSLFKTDLNRPTGPDGMVWAYCATVCRGLGMGETPPYQPPVPMIGSTSTVVNRAYFVCGWRQFFVGPGCNSVETDGLAVIVGGSKPVGYFVEGKTAGGDIIPAAGNITLGAVWTGTGGCAAVYSNVAGALRLVDQSGNVFATTAVAANTFTQLTLPAGIFGVVQWAPTVTPVVDAGTRWVIGANEG